MVRHYYLSTESDWTDWRASPLLALTLAAGAPAFVVIAGYDLLREEDATYVDKLRWTGFRSSFASIQAKSMAFSPKGHVLPTASRTLAEIEIALRSALGP
jgi:acetyl esterase